MADELPEHFPTGGSGFPGAETPPEVASDPKRSYRKLTFKERSAIHTALLKAGVLDGEFFVYNEGVNDELVGDTAIPDYPGDRKQAVAGHRVAEFGKLRLAAPAKMNEADLQEQLRAVREHALKLGDVALQAQQQCIELELRLSQQERDFECLLNSLGTNLKTVRETGKAKK